MSAAPVDEEPEVALTKWAIIRAADSGHYHFIGMKSSAIGRFSSRIVAFNLSTMMKRWSFVNGVPSVMTMPVCSSEISPSRTLLLDSPDRLWTVELDKYPPCLTSSRRTATLESTPKMRVSGLRIAL